MTMPTIGYYPGCSLKGTAGEYEHSLKALAGRLGVELAEIPEWVCCGATSAHAIDHHAALALAADTLAKARKAGLTEVLAPCAMCYQRLASAVHEMAGDKQLSQRVSAALGEEPGLEKLRPVNVLQWLASMPADSIKALVSRPLAGLKVACYYGCLLVRPGKITGETEVEAPRGMEKLVSLAGGEPVRWSMALECCGASFALSRKEVVLRQTRRIYDAAKKSGAEVICLACPMCHANLDMRQAEIGIPKRERLPVVYLTQLMAWSMGVERDDLGFRGHFVPVSLATGN